MTVLVEYEMKDLMPNDFIGFIHNWAGFTQKYNPYVKSMTPVQGCGTKYQTYKTVTKAPWPIYNRYMFTVCYEFLDYGPNEHILITSDKGLDSVFD